MAAPVLSAHQRAAIERMTAAAKSRDLRIIWQGICKLESFAGARIWGVQSATRAHRAHMVWIAYGRLMCTCEARKNPHIFTCSHAQAVRLHLLKEAAQPRSIPANPDDDPTPPTPRGGARCPTCGFPADPDEIDQLGECLDCLQDANAREEKRPPLCACGQIATGETADAYVCDECAARREEERKAEQGRRKAETAERIIAREDARQKATRKNPRTRAAIDTAKATAANAAAKVNTPKPPRKSTAKSAAKSGAPRGPKLPDSPPPVSHDDAIFRTKTLAGRA